MDDPCRGEVWLVDLDPVRGREQAGRRPALVLSVDAFNAGPADLVVVLPMTSREKRVPFHVEIRPPEGGVRTRTFVKCEDLRSTSRGRLTTRWGRVSPQTLEAVEERVRILLGL